MTLGETIQALRKDAGLSQEALGEKLGVSRQSISKWESDNALPELEKLIAMSKLFRVSVGALLGVEEADLPEGELTDRELAALEAMAKKLTPPAPPTQPVKPKKRWPKVVAILLAVVAAFWLLDRITRLENQLNSLQNNVSYISSNVSSQVNGLTNQLKDILEEQNNLVADMKADIFTSDWETYTVTFSLSATPKNGREGMTAEFTATSPEFETVTVPGVADGQGFTADLTCPLGDDITLSVTFIDGDQRQNQVMDRVEDLVSESRVSLYGNMGWQGRSSGYEGKMVYTVTTASLRWSEGWLKAGGGSRRVKLVSADLHIWLEDELLWEYAADEQLGALADGKTDLDNITVDLALPDLKPDQRLGLSVRYTDSLGRTGEKWLDLSKAAENDDGRVSLTWANDEQFIWAPWEPGGLPQTVSSQYRPR